MATARDSALYTSAVTNKYLQTTADRGGRVVPFHFEVTIESAAATGDTYNLFVLPANWTVADCFVVSTALGASAAAGVTIEIGDSVDADRYIDGLDADAAQATARIAKAGIGYSTTTDTTVLATITVAPVVGESFEGYFFLIPPA